MTKEDTSLNFAATKTISCGKFDGASWCNLVYAVKKGSSLPVYFSRQNKIPPSIYATVPLKTDPLFVTMRIIVIIIIIIKEDF